jgi:hypothetical protein
VARLRAPVAREFALYQSTAATVAAATELLAGYAPATAAAEQQATQRALTARLRAIAARLAPGWLGAQLDAPATAIPLGSPAPQTFVRIGQAQTFDDASFPVLVPLLRAGHIAIDADARDPRVAGLLRALLVRLLAAGPPESIQVRVVDCAGPGIDIPTVPPPVTDQPGLRLLLDEAERWVANPPQTSHPSCLLLVIASLPELTDGNDLARISALAQAGPARRLHIIAAGWPPPPLTAETTQRPLPQSTQISLRNPHAWVSDPPGATYNPATSHQSRLPAPVFLDSAPPTSLVEQIRTELTKPTPATPQRTAAPEAAAAAWREYVATIQRLTASQRAAAALVAERDKARTVLLEQLASLTARLGVQATRLRELAAAQGDAAPPLAPLPAQVAAVRDSMVASGADPLDAAAAAIRTALSGAEAIDRLMCEAHTTSAGYFIRNVAIYGFFTTLAAAAQLPIVLMVARSAATALLGLPCALALSACAFLVAWALIGVMNGSRAGDRSPAAGAIVSLAATFPVLAAAVVLALS